jgi:AP-3 complex subunit delta-1
MVKGIRNHKDKGEKEYIQKCLNEIKEELQSTYPEVKSSAVQKLIYLQMLNYDISWASFHIVELMSSPWFGHKRIGYLAAALTFTQSTDVILLTTHLFRKGFTSTPQQSSNSVNSEGIQYETGAAISCLANICTPDLAVDLLNDIYTLMNSSRPYIRKKAVLVLLRIFKQWPKALRLSFDRLKEKLEDENQCVVSAAVYVICELAAKNPKNYLSLVPQFFKILTTSSNNWVTQSQLATSRTILDP